MPRLTNESTSQFQFRHRLECIGTHRKAQYRKLGICGKAGNRRRGGVLASLERKRPNFVGPELDPWGNRGGFSCALRNPFWVDNSSFRMRRLFWPMDRCELFGFSPRSHDFFDGAYANFWQEVDFKPCLVWALRDDDLYA